MPWTIVPASAEILAVHAALTHTGKILLIGGDQADRKLNDANDVLHTKLFDCASLTVGPAPSPPFDAFCSGHAQLMDGRLLLAGGTDDFPTGGEEHEEHADPFFGLREGAIWNPRSETWTDAALMSPQPDRAAGGGRWYPTLITLADGRPLAIGGLPARGDTRALNNSPEAFSPLPVPSNDAVRQTGSWRLLSGPDPVHPSVYPRCYVLRDGQVFFSTPVGERTRKLQVEPYAWTDLGPPPPEPAVYSGIGCGSVLLPLLPEDGYRARVLIVGGTDTYLFDTENAAAGWQSAGRALEGAPRRYHSYAVLLADGTVAVCGGVSSPSNDASAVRQVERFDPYTNTWSVGDMASVVRNYHSVALLMPDGRVFTAGSNPNASSEMRELRVELYEPEYYGTARPQIDWAPASLGWGEAFYVATRQADQIKRVAMIRAGTATHGWDGDQRFVGCRFSRHGEGLSVEAPPDNRVAPTGIYQLVVIDDQGVPSPGHFVRLAPPARGSSALVQTTAGSWGNYEYVSPRAGGGLLHYERDNDVFPPQWSGPTEIRPDPGPVASVPSMIQSNFGGNLGVMTRIGDRLAYYYRIGSSWGGPQLVGEPGVTGNPAMIQGLFGARGNFEVVVPVTGGGFAHYRRITDAPGLPWEGGKNGEIIGQALGPIDAIALLQSNFGDPGDLEVIARYGNRLVHWRRESEPPWRWYGPQLLFTGATGVPSIIQSTDGTRGNFELVTPLEGGGAGHLWRDNDLPGTPWSAVTRFADWRQVLAAALIESDFRVRGGPGLLEVVLRTETARGIRHVHYTGTASRPVTWTESATLP